MKQGEIVVPRFSTIKTPAIQLLVAALLVPAGLNAQRCTGNINIGCTKRRRRLQSGEQRCRTDGPLCHSCRPATGRTRM